MARLYDRVMAEGMSRPTQWDRDYTPGFERRLAAAPVYVMDNVARYYYEGSGQEVWSIFEDFPNVAPPADAMWVEARSSTLVNYGGSIVQERHRVESYGAMMEYRDMEEGWELSAWMVVKERSTRACGPLAQVVIRVASDGRPIPTPGVTIPGGGPGVRVVVPDIMNRHPESRDAVVSGCLEMIKPLLLGLSFMHCKNVERREVQQPPKLDKKWQKKGNKPLVRYHVLDIDPMRKVLRDEGRSEETGLKKALHICRGHFAHYPDGLFGRGAPETVWRPQHVRGNAKHGVVVKDYNVKAPGGGE